MAALKYLHELNIQLIIIIMMKFNQCVLGVALMAVALTGCSNDEQLFGTSEARTPLAISVTNAGLTKVGGDSFWQSIR